MANKAVELHELWVEGKKMHSWTGKRTPKDLKKLAGLKGVEHKVKYIDVEGRG